MYEKSVTQLKVGSWTFRLNIAHHPYSVYTIRLCDRMTDRTHNMLPFSYVGSTQSINWGTEVIWLFAHYSSWTIKWKNRFRWEMV